ncbi:GDP-L-fucose synthase [Legionella impletisoli]|nr:GDP-L-fucose synthase [Legionella impletisoli]
MRTIFVAGHQGMVGQAILRQLEKEQGIKVLTATRQELDLTRQSEVLDYFTHHRIDQVYLAAAKVGGIHANNVYPAQFIYDNLMIQANIIHASYLTKVQELLFLGSSCIYPKHAAQPITESSLLTGHLEPTNEPYAIAKIAGIKMCESYNRQYGCDYRSVMPTNLYGPNDNFHPENSHVIPALLRRLHEAAQQMAEQVKIWGSGAPRREFLHVDDLAQACVYIMKLDKHVYAASTQPMQSHINIGSGQDCTIKELAEKIASVVGFKGQLVFDTTQPDGTPRKLLDVSCLRGLGWEANINLDDGLRSTYDWFLTHNEKRV